jgi:hypothetical protein
MAAKVRLNYHNLPGEVAHAVAQSVYAEELPCKLQYYETGACSDANGTECATTHRVQHTITVLNDSALWTELHGPQHVQHN